VDVTTARVLTRIPDALNGGHGIATGEDGLNSPARCQDIFK